MSKLELIYTIALGVAVFAVVVYYTILAIKNGWVTKLTQTLNAAIRYAEHNITGKSEKKYYVMKQVEAKCDELGIPYVLIRTMISNLIERIIADHNVLDHDDEQH